MTSNKVYRVLLGSLSALLITLLFSLPVQAETIALSQFATEGLNGWAEKSFSGQTQYSLVEREGHTVLAAQSKDSASALYKKIRIDLEKTPYLNWSWLVVNHLGSINERQKAGDDYAARVYVIIDGGVFFWKTRALNYVWSSNQPTGATWPNAYTDNACMIAIESGSTHLGQWRVEKRNIRADLRQHFGEDLRYIDAIAVMTDTDNSHGQGLTYYRQLYFSSE
ncbi:MAG: DUF3047 domain-containing protein [Gammaproteobacteria bacterium]|nr:DUF3047 domain-containing protein [Gammaproteobacteria bacterium]MBQ0838910.1 DUF3047 domain-containing protein [Gammaproteobacteria bacterium]